MAKDSQCSSSLMFALIPDFPFRDDLRSIIDYPKDITELAGSLMSR
jgi:hypothetical protein